MTEMVLKPNRLFCAVVDDASGGNRQGRAIQPFQALREGAAALFWSAKFEDGALVRTSNPRHTRLETHGMEQLGNC